jgi:hypothetical protein
MWRLRTPDARRRSITWMKHMVYHCSVNERTCNARGTHPSALCRNSSGDGVLFKVAPPPLGLLCIEDEGDYAMNYHAAEAERVPTQLTADKLSDFSYFEGIDLRNGTIEGRYVRIFHSNIGFRRPKFRYLRHYDICYVLLL